VAAELGRRIVSGQYPTDSILPVEADILEEFRVSRTVFREALRSLEAKGMVEARQRRGTAVLPREYWHLLDADVLGWVAQSGADPDMLLRLTELRIILEPGACRLAAIAASEEELQKIEGALSRMRTGANNPSEFQAADLDFHLALLAATGNEYLATLGAVISTALAVSIQRTNSTDETNHATLPAHQRIVDALRQHDGEAAAQASREQLGDTMVSLRWNGKQSRTSHQSSTTPASPRAAKAPGERA